jgi:hypothetical protein
MNVMNRVLASIILDPALVVRAPTTTAADRW